MAIPCPRCGRRYDAVLFAFGRTIDCTCGARVGIEPKRGPLAATEPRFLADAMLGRLARWLRILGFDTAYRADWPDEEIARQAYEQERVVLTRDRRLPEEWRLPRVLVLASEHAGEQLRELARAFPRLAAGPAFTRCSRCNAVLEPVARDSVASEVPARVLREHASFVRCPECAKVYWEGSHVQRMRRALAAILDRVEQV